MKRFFAPRVPYTQIGGFTDARSAAVNPNVPQPDVLGAIARSSGEAVSILAEEVHKDEINRDNITAANRESEFKIAAEERIAQLNPLDPDYERQVRGTLEDLSKGLSDPSAYIHEETAAAAEGRAEVLKGAYVLSSLASRRKAIADEAVRTRNVAQEDVLGNIRQDPDNYELYLNEFQQKVTGLNAGIPQEALPALNEQFADQALLAQATGLAEQKRYDEARSLLDENQGAISPTVFRNAKRLVREIENGQRQEFLASTAKQIAELEIQIDKNDFPTLDAAERKVRAFEKLGLFEGREGTKVRLLKAIQTKREGLVKDSKDLTKALEEYNSGAGISSKKGAALVWQQVARDIRPDDPDGAMELAAAFAGESGWVPPQIAQRFENAERTDNPELLAGAAAFYDRIKAKNPDAEGLSAADKRVALTSAYVELTGTPYKEAAQEVLNRVPDRQTLTARREQFDEDFEDFDARGMLDDELGFDADEVPPAAARAYERRLRLMYELHGQADIAKKAANRLFEQEYGYSAVGSDTESVMWLPPERYFPSASNSFLSPEQKRGILQGEVERALEEAGVTPGIVIGAEEKAAYTGRVPKELLEDAGVAVPKFRDASGIPAYRLVSDSRTKRDLAGGGRPSYMIHVRNSFGNLVPIGMRYVMPTYDELVATPEYEAIVKEVGGRASRVRDRSLFEGAMP